MCRFIEHYQKTNFHTQLGLQIHAHFTIQLQLPNTQTTANQSFVKYNFNLVSLVDTSHYMYSKYKRNHTQKLFVVCWCSFIISVLPRNLKYNLIRRSSSYKTR